MRSCEMVLVWSAVWQCGSVAVWQCESVMWAQVQTIWEAFASTSLAHTLRLQIKDTLHKAVVRNTMNTWAGRNVVYIIQLSYSGMTHFGFTRFKKHEWIPTAATQRP